MRCLRYRTEYLDTSNVLGTPGDVLNGNGRLLVLFFTFTKYRAPTVPVLAPRYSVDFPGHITLGSCSSKAKYSYHDVWLLVLVGTDHTWYT